MGKPTIIEVLVVLGTVGVGTVVIAWWAFVIWAIYKLVTWVVAQ